jgi:hypothetical protein
LSITASAIGEKRKTRRDTITTAEAIARSFDDLVGAVRRQASSERRKFGIDSPGRSGEHAANEQRQTPSGKDIPLPFALPAVTRK